MLIKIKNVVTIEIVEECEAFTKMYPGNPDNNIKEIIKDEQHYYKYHLYDKLCWLLEEKGITPKLINLKTEIIKL